MTEGCLRETVIWRLADVTDCPARRLFGLGKVWFQGMSCVLTKQSECRPQLGFVWLMPCEIRGRNQQTTQFALRAGEISPPPPSRPVPGDWGTACL